MKRRVYRPTKKHCQAVVDGLVVHPLSEYFNWFLIKYGTGNELVKTGTQYNLVTAQLYIEWCKRFLENEHD